MGVWVIVRNDAIVERLNHVFDELSDVASEVQNGDRVSRIVINRVVVALPTPVRSKEKCNKPTSRKRRAEPWQWKVET